MAGGRWRRASPAREHRTGARSTGRAGRARPSSPTRWRRVVGGRAGRTPMICSTAGTTSSRTGSARSAMCWSRSGTGARAATGDTTGRQGKLHRVGPVSSLRRCPDRRGRWGGAGRGPGAGEPDRVRGCAGARCGGPIDGSATGRPCRPSWHAGGARRERSALRTADATALVRGRRGHRIETHRRRPSVLMSCVPRSRASCPVSGPIWRLSSASPASPSTASTSRRWSGPPRRSPSCCAATGSRCRSAGSATGTPR